jgi:hypothetical protein
MKIIPEILYNSQEPNLGGHNLVLINYGRHRVVVRTVKISL